MNTKINKNNVNVNNPNEIIFNSDPQKIKYYSNLVNNCYFNYFDNIFCVFSSVNNILYLVYLYKKENEKLNSIVFFNILENKRINEIKNSHSELITNLRHYNDKNNKRDLIISISSRNNNIKLWNINNFECILDLREINKNGLLFSACFFIEDKQIYLMTSNNSYTNLEKIKVFDLKGNKIKEINDSNEKTIFIDIYYDKKFYKNYILTGNKNNVKSYDYEDNKIYKIYDNKDIGNHNSIIVVDSEGIIKLIESSSTGRIRIWNFHSGQLLKIVTVYRNKHQVFGLCLWNNEFLFAGCGDGDIKLINYNRARNIKDLKGHNSDVLAIKKFIHPEYGECLISISDEIKLWKI